MSSSATTTTNETATAAKASNYKRYFQAIVIVCGAGVIYPLLYLRQNFESAILESFNITNVDLGNYYSVLGMMFLVGYLPSGWLADRFSPKLLIAFSLALTGVNGLFFAQIPDPKYLMIIFCFWGFATGFTFWGALLKSIKMLANKEEQGRFFGMLDGGRGLVEAALATVALWIFAHMAGGNGGLKATPEETRAALVAIIYMYSFVCIFMSICLLVVLPKMSAHGDHEVGDTPTHKRSFWIDIKTLLSIKEVWLVAGIIFCGYQVFWSTYSFSGFLQVHFNLSAEAAGFITVAKLWMRPIGGIGGGIIGDKFGNTKVLGICLVGSACGLLIMSFLPALGTVVFLLIIVLLIGVMTYTIRALYWAILDGCDIPIYITGLGIGLISVIGYLPDVFVPLINGYFLGTYPGSTGFVYFFTYIAAVSLIGSLITAYLHVCLKRKQAKKLGK